MAFKPMALIDQAALEQFSAQFRDLDLQDPASWPLIPRAAVGFGASAVVLVALWFFWLSGSQEVLQQEVSTEAALREEYKTKLAKAVSLDVLKKQREQVQQYVTQLEKQLPSKAEIDALLADISQAVTGRSLKNDLFRPGQVSVKEYYAELPIAIKLSGGYHDMGAFASDIANLSRIVTLSDLSIAPATDGRLTLDATAKTFRYLDQDEVAAQRKGGGVKGAEK